MIINWKPVKESAMFLLNNRGLFFQDEDNVQAWLDAYPGAFQPSSAALDKFLMAILNRRKSVWYKFTTEGLDLLEKKSGITQAALVHLNNLHIINEENARTVFDTVLACNVLDEIILKTKDQSNVLPLIAGHLGWKKFKEPPSYVLFSKEIEITPVIPETIRALILLDIKLKWNAKMWHSYIPLIEKIMLSKETRESFMETVLLLINTAVSKERCEQYLGDVLKTYSNLTEPKELKEFFNQEKDKLAKEIGEICQWEYEEKVKRGYTSGTNEGYLTLTATNEKPDAKIASVQFYQTSRGQVYFRTFFVMPCFISEGNSNWIDKTVNDDGSISIPIEKMTYEKLRMLERIEPMEPEMIHWLFCLGFFSSEAEEVVADILMEKFVSAGTEAKKRWLNIAATVAELAFDKGDSSAMWYVAQYSNNNGAPYAKMGIEKILKSVVRGKENTTLTKAYQDFVENLDNDERTLLLSLKDKYNLKKMDYIPHLLLKFSKKLHDEDKKEKVLDAIISQFPLTAMGLSAKKLKQELLATKEKREEYEKQEFNPEPDVKATAPVMIELDLSLPRQLSFTPAQEILTLLDKVANLEREHSEIYVQLEQTKTQSHTEQGERIQALFDRVNTLEKENERLKKKTSAADKKPVNTYPVKFSLWEDPKFPGSGHKVDATVTEELAQKPWLKRITQSKEIPEVPETKVEGKCSDIRYTR